MNILISKLGIPNSNFSNVKLSTYLRNSQWELASASDRSQVNLLW